MCRKRRQGGIAAGVAATVLLASTQLCIVAAQAASAVNFYIESQPLVKALNQWAIQAGLQVVWPAGNTEAYSNSTPVQGTLEPMEALTMLLEGTGLTFSVVSEGRTVAIRDREQTVRLRGTSNRREMNAVGPRFLRIADVAGLLSGGASGSGAQHGTIRGQIAAGPGDTEALLEVVVTGTHIRGGAPVGSPLTVVTRRDIERSGAPTVDQYFRKFPQNFSGVDSASLVTAIGGTNQSASENKSRGASIDLRGVGTGGTLVLLDGHRIAPNGSSGQLVDISIIPTSALERVEIVSDGASAIYGSDSVAGVVNFVLRRNFDGAETRARYGTTTDEGFSQEGLSQTFGKVWGGGNALVVYDYSRQNALQAVDRDFVPPQAEQLDLLASKRVHSLFSTANLALPGTFDLGVDAYFSEREFSQSFPDVFNSLAVRESGKAASYGANATLGRDLSKQWRGEIAASVSHARERVVIEQTGEPTQASKRPAKYLSTSLRADGPVLAVPGGDMRASVGAEYRQEQFTPTFSTLHTRLERNVRSVYAELFLPLVSDELAAWFARELSVSLAGRYDDYSDSGSSTSPKLGVSWTPLSGLKLRASHARSFRVPLLTQLAPNTDTYFVFPFPDPNAPDLESVTMLAAATGQPGLQPEKARSTTFGFDLRTANLPGFSLSMTYYDIDFKNRIAIPPIAGDIFGILAQTATLGPFIDFDPDPAAIQALFDTRPERISDLTGLGAAGVEVFFDARPANISRTTTSGIDLTLKQQFATGVGQWEVFINGNYILGLESTAVRNAASADLVNTIYNPMDLRAVAGISWSNASLAFTSIVNYADSYENILAAPSQRIGSWVTVDLQFQWNLLSARASLSVQNMFNKSPPSIRGASPTLINLGFDGMNASPVGRFISLEMQKDW